MYLLIIIHAIDYLLSAVFSRKKIARSSRAPVLLLGAGGLLLHAHEHIHDLTGARLITIGLFRGALLGAPSL